MTANMEDSPQTEARTPRLVLITGLSGSGKSTVAKCFEDLGYFCIDNLPLPLLADFLRDPGRVVRDNHLFAVVTDVRAAGFASRLPELLEEIDRSRIQVTLLFLNASDEALVRRFSETRRPHPLAGDRPLIEGIHRERELLADLRGRADMILNTSQWSIHETRAKIYHAFAEQMAETPGMLVSLASFGFKHGIPYGADLLFDVRFLPNPHFVPDLRPLTGKDQAIRDYLDQQPDYHELLDRLTSLLGYLLPRYKRENRSYLSVAVGCTGGHHRSVAVCEALRDWLTQEGWPLCISHRDLEEQTE